MAARAMSTLAVIMLWSLHVGQRDLLRGRVLPCANTCICLKLSRLGSECRPSDQHGPNGGPNRAEGVSAGHVRDKRERGTRQKVWKPHGRSSRGASAIDVSIEKGHVQQELNSGVRTRPSVGMTLIQQPTRVTVVPRAGLATEAGETAWQ
jgi:hypothetical protein